MCLMKQIIQSSQPHKNNPPNIKHEKRKNKGKLKGFKEGL